jgi:hypothetical protein
LDKKIVQLCSSFVRGVVLHSFALFLGGQLSIQVPHMPCLRGLALRGPSRSDGARAI